MPLVALESGPFGDFWQSYLAGRATLRDARAALGLVVDEILLLYLKRRRAPVQSLPPREPPRVGSQTHLLWLSAAEEVEIMELCRVYQSLGGDRIKIRDIPEAARVLERLAQILKKASLE